MEIMDFTMASIGFLLIFIGAYFFGYPIGKIVDTRQTIRDIEEKYFVYPLPECVAKAQKNMQKDILDAEILEVKNG